MHEWYFTTSGQKEPSFFPRFESCFGVALFNSIQSWAEKNATKNCFENPAGISPDCFSLMPALLTSADRRRPSVSSRSLRPVRQYLCQVCIPSNRKVIDLILLSLLTDTSIFRNSKFNNQFYRMASISIFRNSKFNKQILSTAQQASPSSLHEVSKSVCQRLQGILEQL